MLANAPYPGFAVAEVMPKDENKSEEKSVLVLSGKTNNITGSKNEELKTRFFKVSYFPCCQTSIMMNQVMCLMIDEEIFDSL